MEIGEKLCIHVHFTHLPAHALFYAIVPTAFFTLHYFHTLVSMLCTLVHTVFGAGETGSVVRMCVTTVHSLVSTSLHCIYALYYFHTLVPIALHFLCTLCLELLWRVHVTIVYECTSSPESIASHGLKTALFHSCDHCFALLCTVLGVVGSVSLLCMQTLFHTSVPCFTVFALFPLL